MGTSIIRNSDTIQVLRGVTKQDSYGSTIVDWVTPVVVTEGKASVQHFLTTEDDTDRQTTTEGLRLISDDPVLFDAILPTDRISYAGEQYEVDAEIQQWRLFGRVHHIEVYLRRVVG